MILIASQRSGAIALADHLMNDRDNDHVELLELDGVMAGDLHGALSEAHAISKATRCSKFLFSVSLNPPENVITSDDDFRDAADRIAEKMGLENQPRAMVIHEKKGRRHAHVVWSRIDPEEMKAINLPFFKLKMRDISRELHLDHGWDLPGGLKNYGQANPLNFELAQWQQAQRQGSDPREIKQLFRETWERSDTLIAFRNGLEERGIFLAQGDRRGFVALDVHGNIYAISRWAGIKAKDVKGKLGDASQLPSVGDVQSILRAKMTAQVKTYIQQVKDRHAGDMRPFVEERAEMVMAQRAERKMLKQKQEERWVAETKARSERLNKGLRGLFDRLTGSAKKARSQNDQEAFASAKRDQEQRESLITAQMQDRKGLQHRAKPVRSKHQHDRNLLAKSISGYLGRSKIHSEQSKDKSQTRNRRRDLDITR